MEDFCEQLKHLYRIFVLDFTLEAINLVHIEALVVATC